LEELENDEKTKVIAIYLESIEVGSEFLKIASRISKKKPIILVKSGMSNRGMKAASSHT
jgi:acetyltransferase